MIGKTIGRYQIIEKIGEGGMGAVYKAEDSTLNRFVALKTISPHLSENDEARERFKREAQAASALNHPNVTTVHDLLESDDRHFICMEYVEGKTIREIVESGEVSILEAVNIAIQSAEALNAAHQKGILHRDVKSTNIMVSDEGHVKVMDFGLAHFEDRSQLTRTGSTLGTLAYSSPEQLTGGKVDERSEVFSLGVVLYELLAGALPFQAERDGELVHSIISSDPTKITSIREEIPKGLEAVVDQMLQKNPDLRYNSCSEIISDLKITRDGFSTGKIAGLTDAQAKQIRSRRVATLKVAGIALVTITAIAIPLLLLLNVPSLDRRSILVVEFENKTGDQSRDNLCGLLSTWTRDGIENTGKFSVRQKVVTLEQIQQNLNIETGTGGISPDHLMRYASTLGAGTVITAELFQLQTSDEIICISYLYDVGSKELLGSNEEESATEDPERTLSDKFSQSILALLQNHLDPLIGQYVDAFGQPASLEAYRLFSEAESAFLEGTYISLNRAARLYFAAAEEDPSYTIPLLRAEEAFINSRQFARADSLLNENKKLIDKFSLIENQYLRFIEGMIRGNLDLIYDSGLQLAEMSERAIFPAGYAALRLRRPEEAVYHFERINLSEPWWQHQTIFWNHYTDALYMQGSYRKALKALRQGRSLHPDNRDLKWREFRVLAALGRHKEIEKKVEQFSTDPTPNESYDQAYWLCRVGVMLKAGKDPSSAIPYLNRALDYLDSLSPEQSRPRYIQDLKATILYVAGELTNARNIRRQLIQDDPSDLENTGQLGVIEAQLGNLDSARSLLDQIASRNYTYIFGQDYYWRACITAEIGDLDEAFHLMQSAVDAGFSFKGSDYHQDLHADPFQATLRDYQPYQDWIKPRG